jgi:hypothetical protein
MRANRSGWMRLVRNRRLYYCAKCDAEMFLTRQALGTGSGSATAMRPMSPRPDLARERSVLN